MISTPPTAILDQVLALVTLFSSDMERSDRELGLSPSRTHLLWLLQLNGPQTQRQLAESMTVSPRNITGLVDALVETGFVTREPHPDDRRAVLVTLTTHGHDTMTRMQADHEQLADDLLRDLSPDRRERFSADVATVTATLAQLIAQHEASQ
ncbi:MarR family winged helix-turn-helix transcriptional regulator [Paramicrobacterium agarici]|uniref:DNA-binding MarR family transcriptional regulator n=1 Tax=Paramicrobacterium agarici TaxID=630514 RepID=A0A2A9DT85_9MICO|nr:MarR family transcriptional regulator [Microbacterium agarici]PFG29140.1 DNA-binding MarR family transcriptional regulator [Microbacterium agarici]